VNVTVGYTPEKEKEKGDRKSRLASSVLVDQVATLNQDGQEDCVECSRWLSLSSAWKFAQALC
jgi:hypothetical protein